MKILTLATGVAVGYVLGTRAGHERYEQILDVARRVSGRPSPGPAPDEPAASFAGTTVTSGTASGITPPGNSDDAVPRSPRRKPATPAPGGATTALE